MSGIITLLTDFGARDSYVGAMKGAILSIAPSAVIVDITHDVPPQDVQFGAFTLMTAVETFPAGTVHAAVVDPGVGGRRRALAVCAGGQYFVGPDNGLLSWGVARGAGVDVETDRLRLRGNLAAVALDVPEFWRPSVSSTFHGRDIFGPVAAYLSRGESLEGLGSPLNELIAIPFPRPRQTPDGIYGEVLVVDHFGNCITNIPGSLIFATDRIEVAGRTIEGLCSNYESGWALVALVGSSGYLEIAVPSGNAAKQLGAGAGAPVTVMRTG